MQNDHYIPAKSRGQFYDSICRQHIGHRGLTRNAMGLYIQMFSFQGLEHSYPARCFLYHKNLVYITKSILVRRLFNLTDILIYANCVATLKYRYGGLFKVWLHKQQVIPSNF